MSYVSSTEEELLEKCSSERTLAIIKPEAFENRKYIEQIIKKHGFTILAKRQVHLSPEQVAELYQGHYGANYFPHLVAHMSSGPIIALCLAKNNAIQEFCTLLGPARVTEAQAYWPDSLRACFGRRATHGDYYNGIHGSRTSQDAMREVHFFFPTMIMGPILKKWQIQDYLQQEIFPVLSKGLNELVMLKPADPILFLADWLTTNDPESPIITEPEGAPDVNARCGEEEVKLDIPE